MHVQHLAPSIPPLPDRLTRRGALAVCAGAATTLFLGSTLWRGGGEEPAGHSNPHGEADARYAVVQIWGGPGVGKGQFRYPWHLAVTGRGELLVADTQNRRIQLLSRDGAFLEAWGDARSGKGSGAIQFLDPRGIARDAQHVTYVADAAADLVQAFTPDGGLQAAWGTRGLGMGQFRAPHAIAVSPSGHVYVVDTGNHRIQVFTGDGTFLGQWGSQGDGQGQFEGPLGIAIGPEETVLVADTGNHRLQMFSAEGIFLRAWGNAGTGDGAFTMPVGVAFDAQGHVLVTDAGNHRVQLFACEGAYLGQWGAPGTGPGQLAFPQGIAAGSDGLVHVADAGNHRLQTFAPVSVEYSAMQALHGKCGHAANGN